MPIVQPRRHQGESSSTQAEIAGVLRRQAKSGVIVNTSTPTFEDTKHKLEDYITNVYGSAKTEEDHKFLRTMYDYFTFHNIAFLFFLTLWTELFTTLDVTIFDSIRKETRCLIPELEGHFSFDEIMNLTVSKQDNPFKQYCIYDVRNYTKFIKLYGYNYSALKDAMAKEPVQRSIRCKDRFMARIALKRVLRPLRGSQFHYNEDILSECLSQTMRDVFGISLQLGKLASSFFLGVYGDIRGRKKLFILTTFISCAGALLRSTYYMPMAILGNMLLGVKSICFFSIYVNFIECCPRVFRDRTAYGLTIAISFAKYLNTAQMYYEGYYRVSYLMDFFLMCSLPMYAYYVTESPRWLYFRGNKRRAYAVIRTTKTNVSKKMLNISAKSHLKLFGLKLFKKRICLHILLLLTISMTEYLNDAQFPKGPVDRPSIRYLVDSGFVELVGFLLTSVLMQFMGRLTQRVVYFILATILGGIIFLNNDGSQFFQVLLTLHWIIAKTGRILCWYQLSDLYPTSRRLTAFGITCTADAFARIVAQILLPYLSTVTNCVKYGPLLIASTLAMTFSWFIAETFGLDLPDTIREALSLYLDLEQA